MVGYFLFKSIKDVSSEGKGRGAKNDILGDFQGLTGEIGGGRVLKIVKNEVKSFMDHPLKSFGFLNAEKRVNKNKKIVPKNYTQFLKYLNGRKESSC